MAISKIGKNAVDLGTPCVNVYNNAAQTLSATTWTYVTLDTEVIDTQSNFASDTFVTPDVGLYCIIATIEANCSDTDELSRVSMVLHKKPSGGSFADAAGTEQSWFKDHDSNESATRQSVTTTHLYTSAIGDEWKIRAYANAGGGTITLQANSCSFVAFKIH